MITVELFFPQYHGGYIRIGHMNVEPFDVLLNYTTAKNSILHMALSYEELNSLLLYTLHS